MVKVINLPSKAVSATERSNAPKSRCSVKIGLPQERADHGMMIIIGVIQTIGFALHESVHAIMYYMPAKGAEPKQALCRLDSAKKHLARALHLIDEVERSKPKTRN
jgi:hypothetical protein